MTRAGADFCLGAGPSVMSGWALSVPAPVRIASAWARNSSRRWWSARLPKVVTLRFVLAILPSAVIAMLMNTNGRFM